MLTLRHLLAAAGLPAALAFSHCTPYQQQGAAIGGLAGGALGAIAGDDHRDVLRGAALGAAAGTGIAAAAESSGRNAPPPYGAAPQPYGNPAPPSGSTPPPPSQPDYPTARRTSNPDRVISPFAPYNVIDVAGFSSGDLARDPTNQQIFRVP